MNHAPQQSVSDLRKVLQISRLMAAEVDLDRLLGLIIERSIQLLKVQRASLFLYDDKTHELVSRIATGAGTIRFNADLGIAGATVRTNRTIHVPDAYADKRFNQEIDRRSGFRTRNILSVPLHDHEGKIVGVLQMLNKRRGAFTRMDIDLAKTLGAQAGVLLQRDALVEHYLRKQEMERAMQIAREIHLGLLPAAAPKICGFEVAGYCRPADDTGGDTFDFLPLCNGQWMFVVADASGHGIGPALVIAETRAMLRAMAMRGCTLSEILETANLLLHQDLNGRFVTCFLGLLDPLSENMVYSSAGHGPMLFYDRKSDAFTQVRATNIPLGMMDDTRYPEFNHHRFTKGDLAVILTDGFFEATNSANQFFGIERVMDSLRRDRDLPPETVVQNLYQAVDEFRGKHPQNDDLTILAVRRR